MNMDALRSELIADEGLRLSPYRCTAGKLTIGVGRNIEERGISRAEAMLLLDNDIAAVSAELDRAIPWWRDLADARRRALVNMGINVGVPRLLGFRKMLAALQAGDYPNASAEALNSKWAADVGPGRSGRIATMMKEG